ncbi:Bacillibactin transport regulator [Sphingobacterium spiritivorum]|uniref:Bacillibactin transport regulator n=1 Tax=Sphingobacterium spiritivorum TaxID=258 RepID=A0A380CS95_SPHSI|nr:AraC family transcriptional regulator [Sphingobacterium spiritivorum]SUJ25825.1 Bacillibactin transport regulator [Sphingobacterium spiritivorum]
MISPENGVLYLHTEGDTLYIPDKYYAWIPSGTIYKLISKSEQTKLTTLFLEPEKNEIQSDFFNTLGVYAPNTLIEELLQFGFRHWQETKYAGLKESCMTAIKRILPIALSTPLKLFVPAPESEVLMEIIAYIQKHLNSPLDFQHLAQRFNLSERTLSRWFKKETGTTLFQFVKSVRIHKALELMESSDMNINEITNSVGYNSLSTFSSLFKELIGESPQEYKKRFHKKKNDSLH